MRILYHPDTVLTASDLEILANELISEIPIPRAKGCLRLQDHPEDAPPSICQPEIH